MGGPISARRDGNNIMVTKFPDVCNTPTPGGVLPIAYNSVAILHPCKRLATSVFLNGNQDFYLNSRSAKIKGHHPGSEKGVVVQGYEKYSHALSSCTSVYSEGWSEVRDQDPAWINHDDLGPTEPSRPLQEGPILSAWPLEIPPRE